MHIYRVPAFLLYASLAASTSLMADNRVEHFKGSKAENTENDSAARPGAAHDENGEGLSESLESH
ncbi:hypothetical protein [Halopseudomonas salegens]|uniref:Uncharacterized protein n=1 Tax=Halopseudomonas salegens TaxID=1434072 RepID=A0A1H2FAM6_9GAMM|nr:hypothetical protein [Halopseudomonas salegens]SDU04456.1 hypothetical protein SAMN05216210_1419 [Halopseudomonas salegens]